MTAPYRDETATLRAEVERLHAEVAAALRQRGQRRWRVSTSVAAAPLAVPGLMGSLVWALAFVDHGWTPSVERGAIVCAVLTIVWALCFLRRAPAPSDDGGGR